MIRQEHQPFAVKVQSTDGKHPHRYPTEVVLHRRSATWIIQRRHDILRLVQHEIDIRLDRTQMLAVYLNMDAIGIDLRAKLRHDLAVNRYPSRGNQFLGFSPRCQPRSGNDFLQPDFHFLSTLTSASTYLLLPLNRGRRFRADIVHYPIHALHFIDDPVGDLAQYVIWNLGPIGRHPIQARHSTKRNDMFIGPLIAHDSYGPDRQQHGKRLPYLPVQAGGTDFLVENEFGRSQDFQPLLGDRSQYSDGKARPWERLPPDNLIRQT